MCGIAGFAGLGSRADLASMTNALSHRGPDGEGYYVAPEQRVFLGHRRLSIVDIAGGHQPMWNEDSSVGVIFNGEIYNHVELREALLRAGHRFASDHSDTEVLVHGYEQWGDALPSMLNGMFAFAIYDKARRRLFLARDRFGEKPLYYSLANNTLVFASELTSLVQHPSVGSSLDTRSLQKYFAYGYLPAPNCIIQGSRKLPAGHRLSFQLDTGEHKVSAYWRFSFEPDNALTDTNEALLVDELEHLIDQAAARRMMGDVPVGAFLSGGLDSSVVVAAIAQGKSANSIKSFTIGFTEASFDESVFARQVAAYLGTDHREEMLDLDSARDLIPEVLNRLDEPLGDASLLPTFLLSRFVREHVTVALSGDGGDELFAGYDPFDALSPARRYSSVMPRLLHGGIRRLADMMPLSDRNMSLDFKLRRTLRGLSYPESIRLPVWMGPLEPAELAELFEAPVAVEDVYEEAISEWTGMAGASDVDKAMTFFTKFYLQDDILTKVDRAAMMNSLETRAVFLDNDLVDFCRRLPSHFKYRNGERKYLLKEVARRRLPQSIVERKKKGFGIPIARWLRTVPSHPPLAQVPGMRNGWAQEAWETHRLGRGDHRLFLWSWLSLQHVLPGLSHRQTREARSVNQSLATVHAGNP